MHSVHPRKEITYLMKCRQQSMICSRNSRQGMDARHIITDIIKQILPGQPVIVSEFR
nr:MAG TPA: hypothetical protein [Caudoviricetes sp.]